jgi:vacuolar protein sorting-associated protein 45
MIEVPGMKALVLDVETTGMVSLVFGQSQIIAQDCVLVERIDPPPRKNPEAKQPDTPMHHLKAIVYIRPVRTSIAALKNAIKQPKYKEYHVFFSNIVRPEDLKDLAEADEFDVVRQVQEYYGDVYAVNPCLWHLNLFRNKPLYNQESIWTERDRSMFRRNVDGVIASLLAMKKRPAIRFARSSELARKLATEVSRRMTAESELFHFGPSQGSPLLIILDRRDDPATPLLLQWTYQAMVHELIGIANNRVDMSKVEKIRPELREVVLSCDQDRFFKTAMHLNYGDMGACIKEHVEEYQKKFKSNQKIQTIADMQRFVDEYPDFKSLSGSVSKHVALVTEINRLVDARDLMAVSEVEQELACHNDHGPALEKTMRILDNPRLTAEDRLRVVLLYSIRYEEQKNHIATLKALLRDKATDPVAKQRVLAVDALLTYAGQNIRGEVSSSMKIFDRVRNAFGSSLKGVDNIYTQHKPALFNILDAAIKRNLKTNAFPYVDGSQENRAHDDIFVFVIGGVTFEEEMVVHTFNQTPDVRIVLGGSCIHNSQTFLSDVLDEGGLDSDIDLR